MKYRQCRERQVLGVAIAGTVVAATLPILTLGEGHAIASEPSQLANGMSAESIAQDFQSGGNPSKEIFIVDTVPGPPVLPATAPLGDNGGAGNRASPIQARSPQAFPIQASSIQASPLIETTAATDSLGQITSVSQLSDVQPTDWAFQALQSLVERYGCIVGYPDGTFRGQRALSRYEFAAGLNACLNRINELIASATADMATKEDLAKVQRLQEEFATELAAIRGRVDNLEARTAQLEVTQFSTTTKLVGDAIFSLSSASGSEIDGSTIFSDRLRLDLNTTFSGQDLLFTRLQAANTPSFEATTGTPQSRLSFDGTTGDGNDVVLDTLRYQFFFNPRLRVTVSATGTEFDDIFATLNPEFSDDGVGSLSRFGQYSPLYRLGDGAGLGLNYDFSKTLNFSAAYFADDAGNPADKAGLFNGQFAALGQLTYRPSDRLGVGLAYSRYYAPGGETQVSGGTGSVLANQPFEDAATAADIYALNATYRLSSRFNLSGWYGYTTAQGESSGFKGDRATIQNWAVTLGFLDLLAKGNLAGIVFGQPPRVTNSDYRADDTGSTYHVEAFYRFRFSDQFALTPGLFVTNNPERDGSSIWVGTLRTSFSF
ncbi:iron uptake porin [Trichothermofontia sp.]